ncbi:hypothetical protein EDD18DRAFT_48516 [Armillaria luteobubalina]|uniref:Uncharacterized protein n=1 Tax=Armillaria luteobubalina TaxID=153913 RepID=A0AA39QBL1_9AGAR|nr:hypothetical protein EDD18DRAFT_48516 [Armillaria luteobubalina]
MTVPLPLLTVALQLPRVSWIPAVSHGSLAFSRRIASLEDSQTFSEDIILIARNSNGRCDAESCYIGFRSKALLLGREPSSIARQGNKQLVRQKVVEGLRRTNSVIDPSDVEGVRE